MVFKFSYIKDYKQVYVTASWEKLKMNWFLVFDYEHFYKRYYPDHQLMINMLLLKNDIVETYVDTVASVPYTKDELYDDLTVSVYSDLIKKVEL